jgi:hypothetical protein
MEVTKMPRGRKPRNWIKIDCEGILRGSINYLLPLDGQAVWVKMIAYSEICGGRPGWIEDNNESGLPHDFIAQELHCTTELFEAVLAKMKKDKAIEVDAQGSIHLVNFDHYQFSEYDRQQPYRQGRREAAQVVSTTPEQAYGEFQNVMLTDEEYDKLVDKFGEGEAKLRIKNLSEAIASKGYRYKSHYATILTWERMEEAGRRDLEQKHRDTGPRAKLFRGWNKEGD